MADPPHLAAGTVANPLNNRRQTQERFRTCPPIIDRHSPWEAARSLTLAERFANKHHALFLGRGTALSHAMKAR